MPRWRMVTYYAALVCIGIASLWGGQVAAILGLGYAVLGALGAHCRWRGERADESVIMVSLAVLSAAQGAVLWIGESPDGGLAEILTVLRLMVAPLMMVEHSRLLRRP